MNYVEYMRRNRARLQDLQKEGGFKDMMRSLGGMFGHGAQGVPGAQAGANGMLSRLNEGARAVGRFMSRPEVALAAHIAGPALAAFGGWRASSALSAAQQMSLQKVTQMFPEVARAQQKDPEMVASIWESIVKFGPHVATDPRVAGTFLRGILDYGGAITPAQIRDLQSLDQGLSSGHPSGESGFGEIARGVTEYGNAIREDDRFKKEKEQREKDKLEEREFRTNQDAFRSMTDQARQRRMDTQRETEQKARDAKEKTRFDAQQTLRQQELENKRRGSFRSLYEAEEAYKHWHNGTAPRDIDEIKIWMAQGGLTFGK